MKRNVKLVVLLVLAGICIGQAPKIIAKATSAYDFFDTLVDVRSELVKHFVDEPDQHKMLEGSIHGMIETLGDPYTDYFNPESLEAFDKQTRASFSGIGAEIGVQDGNLTIITPLDDSPAFKAGLTAGDIITEIDGGSTTGVSSEDAVKKITGPEGSQVTLKVRHGNGETQTIVITRQRINIQTIKGFRRDADHKWQYMLDPKAGVAYIRLAQFSDPTADELKKAIETAKGQGLKGLILDLRFDPGGLLDQAIRISDMFLSKGVIVSTSGRNSPKRVWEATNAEDVGDFPLIVIVNEASASASEILSGALKDNNRAIILGTRSFGKGSVQQVMALPSGNGAVKITIAHYFLPSGRNIHRKEGADTWGVDPNDGYYVPMSYDQIKEMNKLRHEGDVLKDGAAATDAVTPDFLEKKLSDFQLAAALKAMLIRLEKGAWEPVGQSNATLMSHVTEKAALETRRTALMENLEKINTKLKDLDDKIGKSKAEPSAEKPAENKPAATAGAIEKPGDKPADKSDTK
jgi:carboxyl-terminal processing protease